MAAAFALSAILSAPLPDAILFNSSQAAMGVSTALMSGTSISKVVAQEWEVNYKFLVDPDLVGINSSIDFYMLQALNLFDDAVNIDSACRNISKDINLALIEFDGVGNVDFDDKYISKIKDLLHPILPILERKIITLEENNKIINIFLKDVYRNIFVISDAFMSASKKINIIEPRGVKFREVLRRFCRQIDLNFSALSRASGSQKELICALKNVREAIRMSKFGVFVTDDVVFDNKIDENLQDVLFSRINDDSEFIIASFDELEAEASND
ncbi:MAG: hypothetical protein ABF739_03055 [Acetobacter okinawensis]